MSGSMWRRLYVPLSHPSEADPVPIVGDGIVATAVQTYGRWIPVLILDTSSRPDIETMVRAHGELGPGDAISGWSFKTCLGFGLAAPTLVLRFTKPSQCLLQVEFDLEEQGILVDQILWAQGVYLQPGRPGDRLAATIDNPRILVEVPAREAFAKRFRSARKKALFRRFRSRGMSRIDSKNAVRALLREFRSVLHQNVRFRSQEAAPGQGKKPPPIRERRAIPQPKKHPGS